MLYRFQQALLLPFVFLFFTLSLNAQTWAIHAHLTGFPEGTVFYLMDPDTNSNIDSTVLKSGRLSLTGSQVAPPAVYWLTAIINKQLIYTVLLFGNETLTIEGDRSQFPFELSIKGSSSQEDFNKSVSGSIHYFKFRDKMIHHMMEIKGVDADHQRDSLWLIVRREDSLENLRDKAYINEHTDTYAALINLFYQRQNYSADSLRMFLSRVTGPRRSSSFAKRIDNYLSIGSVLKIGDDAYDFTAADSAGRSYRLSSFTGKYILLDFSSTYCGPCAASIPELKEQHKKYSDSLAIISLSADQARSVWTEGARRDAPTWLSLSDGKGPYSETFMKYGVQGYPTFCLINPAGKIIDIAAGYGKDEKGQGSVEKLLAKHIGH